MATHYGQSGPARLGDLDKKVLSTIATAALAVRRPIPQMDRAAQLAAGEIAAALPPEGPPPSTLVEFALRSHGIVDPPPHMVIANLPEGMEKHVLDQLEKRLREILGNKPFTRVGISIARPSRTPDRRRILVALLEHRIDIAPTPRELKRDQEVLLRFSAATSHHNIKLLVTSPGGTIAESPLTRIADSPFSGKLTCRRRGVYQVEVTGEGRHGPEVLANFPVHCAQTPPREVRYGAVRRLGAQAEQLERDLFKGTNKARRKRGLKQLAANRKLADVARRHSGDMRDNRFVGHVSPTTGRPIDRVRVARIPHLVVRENVAQAYSVEEALRELLNSPAHRQNILSQDVTDLGIGVVVDKRGATPVMLVTQLFLKPARPYDPATAHVDVLRSLRKARSAAGLGALKVDEQLDRLAGDHVKGLLQGDKGDADAVLAAALRKLGGLFSRVDGLHIRVPVIEALERAEEIKRKRYTHVGIGVERTKDQIVIFLLLAGRQM